MEFPLPFPFPFRMMPNKFTSSYRCYCPAMMHRPELESCGKIILPSSALGNLARLHIDYPMLFSLSNPKNSGKKTHCGVLEFTAEEGFCYVPYWMMQNLLIDEGEYITVASINLPKGKYVKMQPLNSSFLDIANPRAVLEICLRNFSCFTKGDIIPIDYNKKTYKFSIVEVKPENAVSIVETDIHLDFAPPLDYQNSDNADLVQQPSTSSLKGIEISETQKKKQKMQDNEQKEENNNSNLYKTEGSTKSSQFKVFSGAGYTLRSNAIKDKIDLPSESSSVLSKNNSDNDDESSDDDDAFLNPASNKNFRAFSGSGYSLKKRN